MWKYVIKRLLWLIPIVIGVAILIFTIMYFVPGDPATVILSLNATDEEILAKRAELGLDQPYIVQLGRYLSNVFLHFDFGKSYLNNTSIAGEIIESGSLEDLFTEPSHPYTIGLFNSIPRLDVKVEKLQPVPGLPPDPARLPEGCHFAPRCPYATDECRAAGKVPFYEVTPGHLCRCYRFKKEGDK